jgi:hypothetical protein
VTGYEIVERWREPHEDCTEDNHAHDCFCPAFDDCADELEAFLKGLAELNERWRKAVPMLADELDALLGTPKEVAR